MDVLEDSDVSLSPALVAYLSEGAHRALGEKSAIFHNQVPE